jgi:hypothetical protein
MRCPQLLPVRLLPQPAWHAAVCFLLQPRVALSKATRPGLLLWWWRALTWRATAAHVSGGATPEAPASGVGLGRAPFAAWSARPALTWELTWPQPV